MSNEDLRLAAEAAEEARDRELPISPARILSLLAELERKTAALVTAERALEIAIRAATASAGFTGEQMAEIIAENPAIKAIRTALEPTHGS